MEDELCRHAGLYGWQPCQFRAHASSGDVERLDKGRPIFLFNANHVNKVQRTKRFGRDCITVLHNGGETLIGAPAGTANSAALERWHRFLRGRGAIGRVEMDIESTVQVMHSNVTKLLSNQERIDDLQLASQQLNATSSKYRKQAQEAHEHYTHHAWGDMWRVLATQHDALAVCFPQRSDPLTRPRHAVLLVLAAMVTLGIAAGMDGLSQPYLRAYSCCHDWVISSPFATAPELRNASIMTGLPPNATCPTQYPEFLHCPACVGSSRFCLGTFPSDHDASPLCVTYRCEEYMKFRFTADWLAVALGHSVTNQWLQVAATVLALAIVRSLLLRPAFLLLLPRGARITNCVSALRLLAALLLLIAAVAVAVALCVGGVAEEEARMGAAATMLLVQTTLISFVLEQILAAPRIMAMYWCWTRRCGRRPHPELQPGTDTQPLLAGHANDVAGSATAGSVGADFARAGSARAGFVGAGAAGAGAAV